MKWIVEWMIFVISFNCVPLFMWKKKKKISHNNSLYFKTHNIQVNRLQAKIKDLKQHSEFTRFVDPKLKLIESKLGELSNLPQYPDRPEVAIFVIVLSYSNPQQIAEKMIEWVMRPSEVSRKFFFFVLIIYWQHRFQADFLSKLSHRFEFFISFQIIIYIFLYIIIYK